MGQSQTHSTILFLGLEGSGKTSIIKFCDNGFKVGKDEIKPTVGHEIMHIKANKVQFTAFDVPGKKRFHDLWKKYYKECDAVVWVVDAAGEDMNDVADTLANVLQAPELRNAIFLIAFNKTDKQGAKNTEELTNALQLGKVMGKRKFRTQDVCAIDGKGIQEGIAWLAGEIKKAKSEKKDEKK